MFAHADFTRRQKINSTRSHYGERKMSSHTGRPWRTAGRPTERSKFVKDHRNKIKHSVMDGAFPSNQQHKALIKQRHLFGPHSSQCTNQYISMTINDNLITQNKMSIKLIVRILTTHPLTPSFISGQCVSSWHLLLAKYPCQTISDANIAQHYLFLGTYSDDLSWQCNIRLVLFTRF